jgi:tRNA threonylcarbamoyladenosine biosynthesis protein TsaB
MPSYLLAVDTTSNFGSLALADGPRLIEERSLPSAVGSADLVMLDIERLLADHGVALQDVAYFAAASGPGTFTGVRAGLTAVKGLADAGGHTIVAVSNLQALAWTGSGPLRAPYLDARRGEVFAAIYDAQLRVVQEEAVVTLLAWIPDAVPFTQTAPLGAAIAAIAWERFMAGLGQDPAHIDANYVRRNDAQMMWRDQ